MEINSEFRKFEKKETGYINMWSLLFLVIGFGSIFIDVVPNIIISFCFTLTATGIVYRFLGGLAGSSFSIKGAKLVGSIAVIYVITSYIDSELKDQRPVITPSTDIWTAVDQSGRIIPVTIGGEIHFQDSTQFLTQAEWYVTEDENGTIWVSNSDNRLARFDTTSLSKIGYFNWIEMEQGIQYIDKLTVGSVGNLSPIYPLKIRATAFRDEYNGFDVLDQDDVVISAGTLRTRNFKMIKHKGKYYIILVRGAVHNDPNSEPWASFGVMQIVPITR